MAFLGDALCLMSADLQIHLKYISTSYILAPNHAKLVLMFLQ